MKKIVVLTIMAVALAFIGGQVFAAAQPDKIMINEIQKMKGPVPFDHKQHVAASKDCKSCHHADSPGQEQKCFSCHKEKTVEKTLSLKDAYHKKCIDCHKTQGKGPTKCNDCHKSK